MGIVCLSLQKNEKPNEISNRGAIFHHHAFSDGAVVIGNLADAILCLHAKDGTLKWKKETAQPSGFTAYS